MSSFNVRPTKLVDDLEQVENIRAQRASSAMNAELERHNFGPSHYDQVMQGLSGSRAELAAAALARTYGGPSVAGAQSQQAFQQLAGQQLSAGSASQAGAQVRQGEAQGRQIGQQSAQNRVVENVGNRDAYLNAVTTESHFNTASIVKNQQLAATLAQMYLQNEERQHRRHADRVMARQGIASNQALASIQSSDQLRNTIVGATANAIGTGIAAYQLNNKNKPDTTGHANSIQIPLNNVPSTVRGST